MPNLVTGGVDDDRGRGDDWLRRGLGKQPGHPAQRDQQQSGHLVMYSYCGQYAPIEAPTKYADSLSVISPELVAMACATV